MGLDYCQALCCIDGCESFGSYVDYSTNRLYCEYHWRTTHAKFDGMKQGFRHSPSFIDDDVAFLKTLAIRLDGDNRDKENNNG